MPGVLVMRLGGAMPVVSSMAAMTAARSIVLFVPDV